MAGVANSMCRRHEPKVAMVWTSLAKTPVRERAVIRKQERVG